MADKEKNVVLNFKMDGQVKYAETLREINAVMNTAAKEYKNHISAMGDDAKATDKLAAEKKKLEIQMEAARKRTGMLRAQYEAMSKDTKTTTGQLTQMYGKLLDAEKAEIALEKSLDRVNEGLTDQAQEARDAQENLEGLKKESGILEAEQKKLTSAFKLQSSELGDNATEAEKLELAQKQLREQSDLTERTVRNLEDQLEQTKKMYGENSVEVMQLETKLNGAKSTLNKFSSSLDDVDRSSKDASDGIESLGKKMDLNNLIEATELLAGISEKLIEIGQAGMDSAFEFGESQSKIRANLSLTEDEVANVEDVIVEVFKNGVVDSIGEAADAVIFIKQSFEDLNDIELEKLTNQITTLARNTETDVNDNVRAAQKLMMEFGLTGEESLNLIAAGYQEGLNKSDDFTDTLNEYAPLFADAEFSAGQMLGVLKNGLEGGALNTDKAADAIKELQIRFADGSFEDSLDTFSSGTGDLFEKWKNGEATMSEVMGSIRSDIQKMDTTEQQAALSTLSTQFEDLGVRGTVSVLEVSDAFDDVGNALDEATQKNPADEWASSMNDLKTLIVPIGQELIEGLTPVLEGLGKMTELFSKLPGPVQNFIIIFSALLAIAAIAIPIIGGVAAAGAALNIAWAPVIAIILAVIAVITLIILAVQNWGDISDWLIKKWVDLISWLYTNVPAFAASFVGWINDMKQGAINKFTELVSGGVDKFNALRTLAGNVITGFRNDAINKATDLKTSFINKANELKDGAVSRFNSLRDKAGSVMESTKNKIINPIESAKDKVGEIVDNIIGFFSGLGSKLKIEIPKPKLPRFSIQGDFSLMPPSVPTIGIDWRAKGGIFTAPTIFGQSGGRLQGAGEAGPEAVLPLNDETLGAIGRGISAAVDGSGGKVEVHVYLDADEMNTKLAPGMSKKLNRQNKVNARGVGVIVK